jgi:hypothetical protein
MRLAIACIVLAVACSGRPAAPPPITHRDPPPPPPVLTSPGPLATVHEALDQAGACNACHVDNTPAIANDKCLGCHDHQPLAARMVAGKGLHASAVVKGKPCKVCHRDHEGRAFDLRGWSAIGGMPRFDHDLTGWKLHGGHQTAPCDRCHTRRDRQGLPVYIGTDRLCGACHARQPHGFDPKRRDLFACDRCHNQAAWKPPLSALRFNHDDRKDTHYALGKAHATVACAKCHPNALFDLPAGTSARCESCHPNKSPHKASSFGSRPCEECHSTVTWKTVSYDHGFDLGAHKRSPAVTCYSCHPNTRVPAIECERCHAKDSRHGARFAAFGRPAPHCATCHPMTSWKPNAFDHRQTKFPLTHKHATLRCRDCHRGSQPDQFEKLGIGSACTGCHAHAIVHDGKYPDTDCLKCHGPMWATPPGPTGLLPIHGPTGAFPLVARHKLVPCADCHDKRNAQGKMTFDGLARECGTKCHSDPHLGRFGATCTRCHDPGTWKPKIY